MRLLSLRELRVKLLSLKEEKDITVLGVIHRYEEQMFICERIINKGPLGFFGEICDEFYKDKKFVSFRGGKL